MYKRQPWERRLRPRPQAEISLEDARALGVEAGDCLEISTPFGSIRLEAAPTQTVRQGEVYVFHGYREADVNRILDPDNLDPYSGFPAFRSAYCRIDVYKRQHQARVGVNMGGTFGPEGEGFVRLNFACPRTLLAEALKRIASALDTLSLIHI